MPHFGLLLICAALGLLVFGLALAFVQIFNQLAANHDQVAKAFADIHVLLKQRHDELPALKAVAEAWGQHEAGLQERMSQLASQAQSAPSLAQQLLLENEFGFLLWNFLGRREAMPSLEAPSQFLDLQKRCSQLEAAIAARRQGFNAQVAGHNALLEQLPARWLAPWLGRKPLPYLENPRA